MYGQKIFSLMILSAVIVLIGAGCAAPQTPAAINAQAPEVNLQSVEKTINISNFAFAPSELAVTAGTVVVWKNLDSVSHLVSSPGNFESAQLAQGEEYRFTFSTAGTFDYTCKIHPSMKGKIIVKP